MMNIPQDVQDAVAMCRHSANELRNLAKTESSQTCRDLLNDAAHHLEVALAECSYTMQKV